jgi:ER-bound oxygenase mpaB/B'/Rubber oxygenase, catalytic domain
VNTILHTESRLHGDPAADACMSTYFKKNGYSKTAQLISLLGDVEETKTHEDFPEIVKFLNANKKVELNKKEISRATDFYKKHQNAIGLLLACYSLPYCYLGENGARVLGFSKRMETDTHNRLKETGLFLKTVLKYDNWMTGLAQNSILKVRLLHAMWRYKLSNSDKWDMAWGVPINQEDMIGTNLSFSLLIIRGLKKMGVNISISEEAAYMSLWNDIGHLMGIYPNIDCTTYKLANAYDKSISQSQFKESEIGKSLTKSLFDSLEKLTNNKLVHSYLVSQSRILLGPQYSEWLGIKETRIPNVFLKSINLTSSIISSIYD